MNRIIAQKSIESIESTAVAMQRYAELLYAIGENLHVSWQEEAAWVSDLARHHARLLHLALKNNAELEP